MPTFCQRGPLKSPTRKFLPNAVFPLAIALLCAACSGPRPNVSSTAPAPASATGAAASNSGDAIDSAAAPVTLGVLSIDSAVSVNERYGPLLSYLSEAVGRPFQLKVLSQATQFTQVEDGNLDFITNNPLAAVQVQRFYDTDFLVTLTRPKTGTEFSGLIVVDRDSEIKSVEDLNNKRAACVNFQTAAAGCTFQIYHLLQQGFDPHQSFSKFVENKSQDNIVLSVLNGTIDVGFVRTGQLEKMVNKGLLSSLEEVRIIDLAQDDFFYPHTTALYPEWPVAALAGTDPELSKQVKAALLEVPTDHPALASLKAEGFAEAVDYGQIDSLIEALQLKSWDVETAR